MALVLLSTMPSGDNHLVDVRNRLFTTAFRVCSPHSAPGPVPTCMHVSTPFHRYSSSLLYVGDGSSDCQSRPSPWYNPFAFLEADTLLAICLFRQYLETRSDLSAYLAQLGGKTLVCDCSRGQSCHSLLLIEFYTTVFLPTIIQAQRDAPDELSAMDEACVMEGFDDDDSGTDDLAPAPTFRPDIEAINETCRTGAARLSDERSGWLPSWLRLIQVVRGAQTLVFLLGDLLRQSRPYPRIPQTGVAMWPPSRHLV